MSRQTILGTQLVEDTSLTFLLARYYALCYETLFCISAAHAMTLCHHWIAVRPTCLLLYKSLQILQSRTCSAITVLCRQCMQCCNYLPVQDTASNGWRRPRSANSLNNITGTVLWAPLAVLEGEQHSESSMLERLFISSLSISCNGKLAGRYAMRPSQLQHCARLRRGQLTRLELDEFPILHHI